MLHFIIYEMLLLAIGVTASSGQMFDDNGNLKNEVRAIVYGEYDLNNKKENIYILKNLNIDQNSVKLLSTQKKFIERQEHPQLYARFISIMLAGKDHKEFGFFVIWVRKNAVRVDGQVIDFSDFLKRLKVFDEYQNQVANQIKHK